MKGECSMKEIALKEHLYVLEEKLLQSDVRKSVIELEELLAHDFVEFGSSGRVFNKEITIGRLPNEETVDEMTITDFEIKLLASHIVLTTFRLLKHASMEYSLRSSIWKLTGEHWQMIFHQGTPTKAP
ncbi:hypothetical protein ABD68_06765 [Bacillus endophyticus]|jgi:hypothetical protein|nr:hypothetical protein [Priestia endophytica]